MSSSSSPSSSSVHRISTAEQSLCWICCKLPLTQAEIEARNIEDKDEKIINRWPLGMVSEIRSRNCPFCWLVISCCDSLKSGIVHDKLELRLVWHKKSKWFRFANAELMGSVICFTEPGSGPVYRARSNLGPHIDTEVPKRWLLQCEQSHEKCKLETPSPGWSRPYSLRVIDVESSCLVNATEHCRYVALSYVWGKPGDGRLILTRDNLTELMTPGSLTFYDSKIPTTISDAMRFVRLLGERFLWVDSLCLVQNDPQELDRCLASMDTIYKLAVVTVVAASGSDAYSGLPGIKPTRRKSSPLEKTVLANVRMTSITVDCDVPLRASHYASRAWT
jgi:hypothetical protein